MPCRRACLVSLVGLLLLPAPNPLPAQRAGGGNLPIRSAGDGNLALFGSGRTTARFGEREQPGPVPLPPPRFWWNLWSTGSDHDRVFLGMWTAHPFGDDPYPQESNNGFGVQYRSVFGFTCINSFERRTYAVGVERVWLEARRGPLKVMLGFRAGLIHGYDTRLFRIAGDTPVLPFAGTVALLRLGPVGGEVSWVYQAVSLVGAVFF